MKRFVIGLATIAVLALTASSASAADPSAKTAARAANLSSVSFNSWAELEGLQTNFKVPEQKELIFDVALQCGLYTYTSASSKKSVRVEDEVEAGVRVAVKLINVDDETDVRWAHPNSDIAPGGVESPGGEAMPYGVTYCYRLQNLAATFQGDLLSCIADDGTVVIDDDCLSDETVELTLWSS
jgi:hypothetical protein